MAVLVVVVTVVACATAPDSGATAPPESATSRGSPPPRTEAARSSVEPSAPATPVPITVEELATVGDPLGVFGGRPLAITARIDGAGAMDPCPMNLEPAWFDYCQSPMVALWAPIGAGLMVPARIVARTAGPPSAAVWAVLHPTVEPLRAEVLGHVVTAIAHYDDPAAQQCHHTAWPAQYGPEPTVAETIRQCRATLVITAFAETP